jgi:hypothetical protein
MSKPWRVAGAVLLAVGLALPSAVANGAAHTSANSGQFKTPSAVGVYYCGIFERPGVFVGVECESDRVKPRLAQKATLKANGRVKLCRDTGVNNSRCQVGNPGEEPIPTLGYGRRLRVGRFLCKVRHAGLTCVVAATGKGFFMTRDKLEAVGGAKAGTTVAAVRFTNCGTYKSLRVKLHVRNISCSTAQRIVSAYFHGPGHSLPGIYRVRGYPSWRCSSGTRSGGCALHGHFGANVPEIEFSYL